jgi:hypothetical protein
MPTTTTFSGTGGLNCNGASGGTMSGGTKGRIYYKIPAINDGNPIVITGVSVDHPASKSADTFNFYFVSSDKKKLRIYTGGTLPQATYGQATIDYFNSLLVDNCWPANKQVTEYCPDADKASSGSCAVTFSQQKLHITWMTPEEYLAQTTKMKVHYYADGVWNQVK